jgi:hypothetical protein
VTYGTLTSRDWQPTIGGDQPVEGRMWGTLPIRACTRTWSGRSRCSRRRTAPSRTPTWSLPSPSGPTRPHRPRLGIAERRQRGHVKAGEAGLAHAVPRVSRDEHPGIGEVEDLVAFPEVHLPFEHHRVRATGVWVGIRPQQPSRTFEVSDEGEEERAHVSILRGQRARQGGVVALATAPSLEKPPPGSHRRAPPLCAALRRRRFLGRRASAAGSGIGRPRFRQSGGALGTAGSNPVTRSSAPDRRQRSGPAALQGFGLSATGS